MSEQQGARADLARIVASARRLGVEMDEADALQWLTAVALAGDGLDVVVDADAGVFGHRVTMLDFSAEDLAYFRQIGRLVEFRDAPGVETALALSGSAAQSKVQTYPGDCDYFERVNIHAASRDEACRRLAALIREKALATMVGDTYRLMEVRFGSYPAAVTRDGVGQRAGAPVSWSADEVAAGAVQVATAAGALEQLTWDEVAADPGWCKLDWVVADPIRGQVANASNMLDVTWEAPDGTIVPLDGYLDPYFQEVYLEAESIPLFTKIADHVSSDALGDYVSRLEAEVRKYVSSEPRNYGKAAKRLYNIFRLNGRYEEAAYLRELFDEPAALLYQVGALVRTVDEAAQPGSAITTETIMSQLDSLIIDVVRTLDGDTEEEVVRSLLRLRDAIGSEDLPEARSSVVDAARAQLTNLVNNFFREQLIGLPAIAGYLSEISADHG